MRRNPLFIIGMLVCWTAVADNGYIRVDEGKVLNRITPLLNGSCLEDVNHEVYGGLYSQRIFGEGFEEPASENGISAQWRADIPCGAEASFAQLGEGAYNGGFCQSFSKLSGRGRVGIRNGGLNGWGIPVFRKMRMNGQVMLRTTGMKGRVFVALESADGSKIYARRSLGRLSGEWKKYEFSLRPRVTDPDSRFSIYIMRPGTVIADMAILFENESRQACGFPLRKDIVQAFIYGGNTVLRYGGTMVNSPQYHLKDMIGPRENRPTYSQVWNRYATNGFGVEEFLQLCEATGVKSSIAIPMSDTPEDVADVIEYLTGPANSKWGAKRTAMGHPAPYRIDYLGMGNEECLFDKSEEFIVALTYDEYIERFLAIHEAVVKVCPDMCFVNTAWWRSSRKGTMEKVFRALDGMADFWDIHPWADSLGTATVLDRKLSDMECWFHEWNPNTKMRGIIFEENGDSHSLGRALYHSSLQNTVRRHGDFVEACLAANALQPYLQHDTHWDQGIIFFTPTEVWGQPPFYAARMASDAWMPIRVSCETDTPLDVVAAKSEDGSALALYIVNLTDSCVIADIRTGNSRPERNAVIQTLSGNSLELDNPIDDKGRVSPVTRIMSAGQLQGLSFPGYSYTTVTIK